MTADLQKKRISAVMPDVISHLYTPEELLNRVLVVSTDGRLHAANADLSVQHSSPAPQEKGWLLQRHFLLSRQSCTFVPSRKTPSQGLISVSFLRKASSPLRLSVAGVSTDGYIASLGDLSVPIEENDIADVSCSSSGFITVLASSGTWYSLQLESRDGSSLSLSPRADSLRLQNLSFVSPSSSHPSEVALLPLTSSLVLLAGITAQGGPELVLLVWDLQYSVLIAQHTLAVPNALGRNKAVGLHIALANAPSPTARHALLLLTGASRASVLAVPLTVPPRSTLAGALGRGSAGARWLTPASGPASAPAQVLELAQARTLKAVRSAMELRRAASADDAFFEYARQASVTELGYAFVKQVLEVVFRVPPKGAQGVEIPYSPKIVRWLLEKKVVGYGMVEGGLFSALMVRRDWPSVVLAMEAVSDVPEDDMISLLAQVVAAHRSKQPVSEDAMQVDSTPAAAGDVPLLPSFLALCVAYSTTPAALRLALRKHLPEAEDLTVVLGLLGSWIERWGSEEETLLPENVTKDARGVPIPVFAPQEKRDIPPLQKVLTFTQSVVDSSFLILLTHPPAQPLLRGLLEHLEPEVARATALAQLAGALQPFATAHARAVREGTTGATKAEARVDWRKRRRAAHEQAAMALGAYQVEELVL
ncbi:hypothetical protein CERSUDRAFT_111138 [Gelatoporia subvermispora B]|uniref:Uncharacterized protein n=1 Tax=Ceriporiopsis subvermispora (strain B) TaxID=914234 RepID=M2QTZ8_CERS8|nr:hypothetical protein CERSUDRAFT_111138 [Gelatoporia subvermispora B]